MPFFPTKADGRDSDHCGAEPRNCAEPHKLNMTDRPGLASSPNHDNPDGSDNDHYELDFADGPGLDRDAEYREPSYTGSPDRDGPDGSDGDYCSAER